jgi:hypothetical protein
VKVGTKSLLFGVHQILIHPWFVAYAWWLLYGIPLDPRYWVAFTVHDLGYWGKPNMDGPEGENHVLLGSRIMYWLFDWTRPWSRKNPKAGENGFGKKSDYLYWSSLVLYHSRFHAKREFKHYSKLCVADKLSFCLTPRCLYLTLANWSGEIHEYMERVRDKYAKENKFARNQKEWHAGVCKFIREWVSAHREGRPDEWTLSSGDFKRASVSEPLAEVQAECNRRPFTDQARAENGSDSRHL